MKTLRRIFVWVLVSLSIQFLGLFYIDNYVFGIQSAATIKSKKVEKKTSDKVPDVKIDIPSESENIKISSNGRYVAYYADDILKVADTKTGNEKNVDFDEDSNISFYSWVPDKNRMLIAEKYRGEDGYSIRFFYYDVDKNTKERIDDSNNREVSILVTKNAEVEDIQMAPVTNVIYIKVNLGGNRSKMYWINVMRELRRIYTKGYSTGEIRIHPHEDKLIYEDLTYDRIYSTNLEGSIKISGVTKPRVIAVDDDDKVYIGQIDNGKVTNIYYGTLENPTSSWNVIKLNEPANRSDIFVLDNGKIYVNDNLKGIVKELSTGKETAYKGRFIEAYDDGIASISQGSLVKTTFN